MPLPKVLLCGDDSALLHTLRAGGGSFLQVEQVSAKNLARDLSNLAPTGGMVVVVHEPASSDGLALVRNCQRQYPDIPVVVATPDFSGATTRLLFISGAKYVLSLPTTGQDVLSCFEMYLPGFKLKPLKAGRSGSKVGKALVAALTPGLVFSGVELQAIALLNPDVKLPETTEASPTAWRGLSVQFFGAFDVYYGGKKVMLTNQAKYLFAYLAYHAPKALHRDHLAKIFWPDKYENLPDSARRSLNVEMTHIRKIFREQAGIDSKFLVFDKDCYRLEFAQFASDILTFKRLHQHIKTSVFKHEAVPDKLFHDIIGTYTGNFLTDFPEECSNWVEVEREHLSAVFDQMADMYSEQLYNTGVYRKAIAMCGEILERDYRMEIIHRRLMQCYAQLGMLNKVEQQYRQCCLMMEREFQSKPSAETTKLYGEIKTRG